MPNDIQPNFHKQVASKAVAAEITLLVLKGDKMLGSAICRVYPSHRISFAADTMLECLAVRLEEVVKTAVESVVKADEIRRDWPVNVHVDADYPLIDGDGYTGCLHAVSAVCKLHMQAWDDLQIFCQRTRLIFD